MHPLTIQPVDPRLSPAQRLIALLNQELAALYEPGLDGSSTFKPEDCLVERSAFLVGFVDGQPAACGAIRPMDAHAAEVKRMYVLPDCRGRGYAGMILAELERLAARFGYAALRLETGTLQPASIRLYEKSGFQRIANYGIYVGSPWSVCFEKALVQ